MTLKEKLLRDYKAAVSEKNLVKKDVLQICRAAVLQVEKDRNISLEDQEVIDVLFKEYKKRSETISELGNRKDVEDKYRAEMAVIENYLPKQLSEDEVINIVRQTIKDVSAVSTRDMGKVMKSLQPKLKGKADGKMVNRIVRDQLSE